MFIAFILEQGEDMQGYVTELMITLESVVDTVDSNFKPMDLMKVSNWDDDNTRVCGRHSWF